MLLIGFCLTGAANTMADTTDYWQVYVNKKVVARYDEGLLAPAPLTLAKKNITAIDTLKVRYVADAPCHDCLVSMYVEDEHGLRATLSVMQGLPAVFKASFRPLLSFQRLNFSKQLYIWYNDGKRKRLLFELKLK
ncbi:hypothetical protein DYU05_07925 [Mucilaginibacter terrenus]|uniref:Uncharacterized protein n=2 Tax=Mucilaginibacter terrenus TaxID=2482727 RepID=A0A3E2NWX1_9SPHI|nr:hypothetical protein DYU05_07925 [Mucilaginibacter terrenus]